MISPEELERYGYEHERIFLDLEQRILKDIVRRIKNAGVITRSADFQLNQLKKLGFSDKDIRSMLTKALDDSDQYVEELYSVALETDYISSKALYEATSTVFVPFDKNRFLLGLVDAAKKQTHNEMQNMTQSLGFVVQGKDGPQILSLSQFYRHTLDQAITDIMAGAFDYNTMLRKAVKQMKNSGIRWINYESGWHNRITVAARRAVMTGIAQMSVANAERVAKQLNTDKYEVSAHANARPTHAVWQGGIYTRKQLEEVCGLGSVTGLLGANCYHTYYPFIEGISKRAYTDEQLKEWASQDKKKYNGKEYTGYEAKQRMRQLETNMRAQREEIALLKEGEGGYLDILSAQSIYRKQMADYADFAKFFNMKQQKERIYMDGLGKLAPASWKNNYPMTDAKKDAIIESKLRSLLKKEKAIYHKKPSPIDLDKLLFDDVHVNQQREHNISFEEAKSYIRDALFSWTVWEGTFENYYGEKGLVYVDLKKMSIRTAFSEREFTENVKEAIEVFKSGKK